MHIGPASNVEVWIGVNRRADRSTRTALRIQVLGPVRLWRYERELDLGAAGRRAVLALLATAAGQPLSRTELAIGLWREKPPPSAANIIQTHVKHLRRILEPNRPARAPSIVLRTVGDGYALDGAMIDVDLARFRKLVSAARHHGDQHSATELYSQALELWHGPPFADIPALATHPKTIALLNERRSALLHHCETMIAIGAAGDITAELSQLVLDQPLDEAATELLVRAYHATGQRARAITTYHQCRRQLADELGIGPSPDLITAYNALLDDAIPQPSAIAIGSFP